MRLLGVLLALGALLVLAGSSGAGVYVPPPPSDAVPVWSPDGSAIVFLSERDGVSLRVVKPDGSDEHRIPWLPASRTYAFSPDWSHVAGPSSLNSSDMVVERLDGSDRVELGQTAYAQTPSWSPEAT